MRGTPHSIDEARPTEPVQLGDTLESCHKLRWCLQHHTIRETQHPISSSFQFPIALPVSLARDSSMSRTIEFNNQSQGQATEIHNGISQGELAPKFIAKQLTIAEKPPGELLGQGI